MGFVGLCGRGLAGGEFLEETFVVVGLVRFIRRFVIGFGDRVGVGFGGGLHNDRRCLCLVISKNSYMTDINNQ